MDAQKQPETIQQRMPVHWWKPGELEKAFAVNPLFKACWEDSMHSREFQYAAWLYELEFRVRGKYRYDVPFSKLKYPKITRLRYMWPYPHRDELSAAIMPDSDDPENGEIIKWSGHSDIFKARFNLRLGNKALLSVVAKWLDKQRQLHGVEVRKYKPKNREWKWLELLDRAAGGEKMSGVERKQISEAKRAYKAPLKVW